MSAIRGADANGNVYAEVYSMIYDSKDRGNNGFGEKLGLFKIVRQIVEDYWEDTFIGENISTNELCLVMGHEVCGFGGGIRYEVIPLPELGIKGEDVCV